jgi:hypothetical protein
MVKEKRKRVLVSVDPKLLSRASIPHWSPHLGSFFLFTTVVTLRIRTVHRFYVGYMIRWIFHFSYNLLSGNYPTVFFDLSRFSLTALKRILDPRVLACIQEYPFHFLFLFVSLSRTLRFFSCFCFLLPLNPCASFHIPYFLYFALFPTAYPRNIPGCFVPHSSPLRPPIPRHPSPTSIFTIFFFPLTRLLQRQTMI